jgi:hypothetical protein
VLDKGLAEMGKVQLSAKEDRKNAGIKERAPLKASQALGLEQSCLHDFSRNTALFHSVSLRRTKS